MVMRLRCATCRKIFTVSDAAPGSRVECAECGAVLAIPGAKPPAPAARPAAKTATPRPARPSPPPRPLTPAVELSPLAAALEEAAIREDEMTTAPTEHLRHEDLAEAPAGAAPGGGKLKYVIIGIAAAVLIVCTLTGMILLAIPLAALAFFGALFAGIWKVFTKAGKPGWAALVPIYNGYVLLQIAGKPGWWLVLLLIPGVNLIFVALTLLSVAANFRKGTGFAMGLMFLPFIFYPILGFGSATYAGVRR